MTFQKGFRRLSDISLFCVTVSQRMNTFQVRMNSTATSASRTEEGDDSFQLPWIGWEEDISEIHLPSLTVDDELEAHVKAENGSGDHDVANTFGFDINDAFPG